jgi:hypothetical protein
MISKEFCREQIARLFQLKGYPRASQDGANKLEVVAALKELVNALQCADSEEQAAASIDFFIQESQSRECPLPADIRRSFWSAPKIEEWKGWTKADIGELCQRCHSWGYIRDGDKFVRCECQNGTELSGALLESMNNPPAKRDKNLRPFGGDDFDATVRRAIVTRMGA